MVKKSNPDAFIFDLDGTLWDAVETYAMGFNEYFEQNNIQKRFTKNDLQSFMGLEQSQYLAAVLPEFLPEIRNEIYDKVIECQYQKIDEFGGVLYDGVENGIKELSKKYKLFIVSNCPANTIKHFLKYSKLDSYITHSIAHGENGKSKHENIRSIIQDYNLQNPNYVGDTNSDSIQSAKANIPFIFMKYGFGECEYFEKSFNSFDEFTSYFTSRNEEL